MYKHILVAVGASLSESALTTAITRARACNARLTALHIVDQMPWWAIVTADSNPGDTLDVIDDHARAVTRYAARLIDSAGIDGIARSITQPLDGTSVGALIAKEAAAIGADLIVLGGEADTAWRHGEARLRDVVCSHARCDVLIAAHAPATQRAEKEMEAIETRFAAPAGRADARVSHRQSAPRK
ncbi:UspA domain-containing protein [Caballeronia novacaledonica]|uniref:UspA domain-containing protein n=1 Tax=Caballeronia novacaledonica TaxID=1544861 RepID=A0A2U3I696_9BURK|nr:universal stress protein [Caballeronia novacaledonica]SPB15679.1 UspA domain-containing protein [Caballeronia novacaledonica]